MRQRASGNEAVLKNGPFHWEVSSYTAPVDGFVDLPAGRYGVQDCESYEECVALLADQVRPFMAEKTWGGWHLDQHNECLTLDGYQVSLVEMRHAYGIVHWLLHMQAKSWITGKDLADLLEAIDDILSPRPRMSEGQVLTPEELTEAVQSFPSLKKELSHG